ncbi:hypothetical protein BV22DRAFT_102551 [Leucogyrophana mollusca]|uniref:Uncharacterized protein n=1 Tax=Leucogyrophana mollusca TaxID=85980 RepID=A0ACB8BVC4_9AGAM|nr:hypothetical protein BV22DRAFT_102551 [Leucogyrophana mollusca]
MPKGRFTSVEYPVPKDEIRPDMALRDTGDTMGIAPGFDPDTEFDPGYNGVDDYGRTLGSPPRPENPYDPQDSQRHQSANLDRLPRSNSRSRSSVPADPAPNTTAVLIKREPTPEDVKMVAVAIKTEDAPDERGFVTFVKSEDGKLDIWNLDHLNLGPSLKVDEDLWVGFSRKVIADTLGGGHQECWLNWQGTEAKGIPYAAFNRSWNSELPRSPGQHGVVFATFRKFNDGTPVDHPIDFFVGENPNDWRYIGRYELGRRGEILPHQLELLPQNVVHNWAKGILKSNWGREWVDKTNEAIVETAELSGDPANLIEFDTEGLRTALNDGRLVIGFTIMKCVGYRSEWHEQLLHYQAHPKPSKSQNKKRKSTGVSKGTPAKRLKNRSGRKASDESHREDGSDDYDGPEDDDELEEGMESVVARSRRSISPEV